VRLPLARTGPLEQHFMVHHRSLNVKKTVLKHPEHGRDVLPSALGETRPRSRATGEDGAEQPPRGDPGGHRPRCGGTKTQRAPGGCGRSPRGQGWASEGVSLDPAPAARSGTVGHPQAAPLPPGAGRRAEPRPQALAPLEPGGSDGRRRGRTERWAIFRLP